MAQQTRVGKTATSIYTEDGYTSVRYHATEVVKFNDKEIILKNGGWMTATTKTRMNQASHQFGLNFVVVQKDHKWYVIHETRQLDFQEGMKIKR